MTRTYRLGKRAETQAETRDRIARAAMELHGTVGPAATTISQIAERAGVQRHTVYAHFPDERTLFMACSGLFYELHPLPDPAAWRGVADRRERMRTGLAALYDWFARNEDHVAAILRDLAHPMIQEVQRLRVLPQMAEIARTLGEGLPPDRQALLPVAMSFHTWRTLRRQSGLGPEAAVEAMVRAVLGDGAG